VFDAKDIGAVVAADPREVAAEYVCIGSRTAAADSAPGAAQPPCGYFSIYRWLRPYTYIIWI